MNPSAARCALSQVRGLLAVPSRWTHGAWARRAHGRRCGARDPLAVRWDLAGALARVVLGSSTGGVVGSLEWSPELDVLAEYLRARAGDRTLIEINDRGGHAAVVALLDRALDVLELRGSPLPPPRRRRPRRVV